MCLLLLWKSERRKNNCYLVFGDKNIKINIKQTPKFTGGLQSNRVAVKLQQI